MRTISLAMLLATGSALTISASVEAQERTYDRSIEMAALQKLKDKFDGNLRGTIGLDSKAELITIEDINKRNSSSVSKVSPDEKEDDKKKKLKPLVYQANGPVPNVDYTMTGSIVRKKQPMIWDRFDKDGNFINPYPGN